MVSGNTFTSDIKIINGEVSPKWWRKSGHSVCIDDVSDLLQAKPKVFIIGKGKPGFMKADKQLRSQLQYLKVELIEEPTAQAIEIFNQLMEKSESVAAGFHLTC